MKLSLVYTVKESGEWLSGSRRVAGVGTECPSLDADGSSGHEAALALARAGAVVALQLNNLTRFGRNVNAVNSWGDNKERCLTSGGHWWRTLCRNRCRKCATIIWIYTFGDLFSLLLTFFFLITECSSFGINQIFPYCININLLFTYLSYHVSLPFSSETTFKH